MKILVSTDTSCLISKDTFKNLDISVFPLNVLIDEVEYLDGVSIGQEELSVAMKEDKNIKTSTPPLGVVIEYFENLFAKGYDQIIHFTISSKFSSMYSLFKTVSSNFFDDKIVVVDSLGASTAMLSQVLYAYDELNKGTSVEDIYNTIEENKTKCKVYVVPENLNSLRKGGRVSGIAALFGNTLGLKPVIALNNGELLKEGMTRKVRSTLIELFDKFIENNNFEDFDFTIINFDGKEAVLSTLENHITEKIGQNKVMQGVLPINVCAHCGPGTVGLAITRKINGKSIKQFL